MRTTVLVSEQQDSIRCNVCQWRCALEQGETGRCLVRRREGDAIVALSDGMVSAATIGPVEDYGFRHFFPDSMVLAVGSWGTPFPQHQNDSHHALIPDDPARQRRLDPHRLVQFAQERLVRGLIWAFNDAVVNQEYLLDALRLARAGSRITGIVTGGLWTKAALDQVGPYLDGINLMLYGFRTESYERLTGIKEWRGILAGIEHAVKRWDCHVEITTPIATGINDSAAEIKDIADWIVATLGPQVPWRLIPTLDSDTSAAVHAREIAQKSSLSYVYGADPTEPTRCPSCGWAVIERSGASVRMVGVLDGRCDNCGSELGLRLSVFKQRRE